MTVNVCPMFYSVWLFKLFSFLALTKLNELFHGKLSVFARDEFMNDWKFMDEFCLAWFESSFSSFFRAIFCYTMAKFIRLLVVELFPECMMGVGRGGCLPTYNNGERLRTDWFENLDNIHEQFSGTLCGEGICVHCRRCDWPTSALSVFEHVCGTRGFGDSNRHYGKGTQLVERWVQGDFILYHPSFLRK